MKNNIVDDAEGWCTKCHDIRVDSGNGRCSICSEHLSIKEYGICLSIGCHGVAGNCFTTPGECAIILKIMNNE